jgi:hypothetical protein
MLKQFVPISSLFLNMNLNSTSLSYFCVLRYQINVCFIQVVYYAYPYTIYKSIKSCVTGFKEERCEFFADE